MVQLSSKQLEPKTLPSQDVKQIQLGSKLKQVAYYSLKGTALPALQPDERHRMKKPNRSYAFPVNYRSMISRNMLTADGH